MTKKQSNPSNASGPSKPVTRDLAESNNDRQTASKHDAILRRLDDRDATVGGRRD